MRPLLYLFMMLLALTLVSGCSSDSSDGFNQPPPANEDPTDPDPAPGPDPDPEPGDVVDPPPPGDIGYISFDSATPPAINLKNMGGTETSRVTFQLFDEFGTAVAGELLQFSLDTEVGGLTLNPTSALTNQDGYASTFVQAGTVATPVRVTATVANNPAISALSEVLTVSTGIPDQNSFSLSASILNPEAWNVDGVEVEVTIRVADRFNHPVPDGTAVTFWTEGASIEPSCLTAGGACSVTWTSQEPRPSDGRVTILAFAIGEESFVDNNGNGVFDDGDTFDDLPREAFLDANENGVRDAGEPFVDFNSNGVFDAVPDGLYNGVLCAHSSLCGDPTINVRDSLVLVMATSSAIIEVDPNPIILTAGGAAGSILIEVWDVNGNMMPAGTRIEVSSDVGTLSGITSWDVPNTNALGPFDFEVVLSPGADPAVGFLRVEVTSPSPDFGMTTVRQVPVSITP